MGLCLLLSGSFLVTMLFRKRLTRRLSDLRIKNCAQCGDTCHGFRLSYPFLSYPKYQPSQNESHKVPGEG